MNKLYKFVTTQSIKNAFAKSLFLCLNLLILLSSCNELFLPEKESADIAPTPPVPVLGKGYYFSKDGDDANPGTKEKPMRTLAKLNTLDLEPDETVYLEGGTVFSGTLELDTKDSGLKDHLVTITSYGTGPATINGAAKEAIVASGSSYLKIKNIKALGAGRKEGNKTNGIKLDKVHGAVIEEITTEGFQKSGLLLYSCQNVEALKVTAKNNGYCGIYVTGDWAERNGKILFPDNDKDCSRNITLKDCVTDNNPGDPTVLDNHSGNGILVELTKGALVDHCTATNNGWDMPRTGNGPIGIWTTSSDSVTIQYCISYRNKTSPGAQDGGGFDLDGGVTNSVIQYCLSYENEGAGYGLYQWDGAMDWNNNTVRYSISINDGLHDYGSFNIWNGSNSSKQLTNCNVYNNVIYNNVSAVIKFASASSKENFTFYNNIFIGKGQVITGPSDNDKFLGNTYWHTPGASIQFRGYNSLQDWVSATGQETLNNELKGLFVDPMLIGPFTTALTDPYQLEKMAGFKLQAKSPVIDKGLDLMAIFKISLPGQDFYGNKIFKGIAPEPGIHELN